MSLTFKEKNTLAKELANDVYLEKDKQLLKKYLPNEKLLLRSASPSRPDLSFDILFLLLDYESKDNIINNRQSMIEVKDDVPKEIKISQITKTEKKKFQKKRSIKILTGQTLSKKTSEMLTQCIQTGSIAIAGCASLIKRLR